MPKPKRRPLHRQKRQTRTAATLSQVVADPTASSGAPPQPSKALAQATIQKSIAALSQARYPFVSGEIVRIGILTGVVVIILVMLAVILPRGG